MNLDRESKVPGYDKIIKALTEDDTKRTDFLKACLLKLGLEVSQESTTVPSLSRLHLSSAAQSAASELMAPLKEIISMHDGEDFIEDENDTFHLEKPSAWSLGVISKALPDQEDQETDRVETAEDRFLDYNTVVKRLVVHEKEPPSIKETPYFNHDSFFANLKHYSGYSESSAGTFGRHILYGEVVTSTNTMLEKYVKWDVGDLRLG